MLYDEKYAREFQSNCYLDNTSHVDYMAKDFMVNDIRIIATIRFFSRDISKPYAQIEYYSCSIEDLYSQWSDVFTKVMAEFKIFRVQKLRMTHRTEDSPIFNYLDPRADLELYLAPISDILANNDIKIPEAHIEQIDHMSEYDYEIYLSEYLKFNEKYPELTSALAEPLSNINKYCGQYLGFTLYINGEWAGFALYAKYSEFCFNGYLVWDKIIFEKYRGRNLSTYIQNKGFQIYAPDAKGFIFGKIQKENIGSSKSARHSGRRAVLSSYFFDTPF